MKIMDLEQLIWQYEKDFVQRKSEDGATLHHPNALADVFISKTFVIAFSALHNQKDIS